MTDKDVVRWMSEYFPDSSPVFLCILHEKFGLVQNISMGEYGPQ